MSSSFAVHAAFIRGVEAVPVTVEISMGGGLPGIQIVGMADAAVLEARQRIRCALRSAGFDVPRKTITVSLAPGDVRKTGTGFDLPIAAAILALSGQIPRDRLGAMLLVGELGLNGSVSGVRGEVSYQFLARESQLILLGGWRSAHVCVEDCEYRPIAHLEQLRDGVPGAERRGPISDAAPHAPGAASIDFSDVIGQDLAKRAFAVAAVGELGAMMIGPPGAGKSMLAQRFPTILPPIDGRYRLEALQIHSVMGEDVAGLLRGRRPFRSPHHSISLAGLLGGGRPVHPGEVSLAHAGILYLDEVGEWSAHTLQALRQPIEDGCVRICRVDGLYSFPAAFQLLAASNPCPCGHLGDPEVACRCSASSIDRYRSRMAGPLMDRLDIKLTVSRPAAGLVVKGEEGLGSADLRLLVDRGRTFRSWRSSRGRDGCLPDTPRQVDLSDAARDRLIGLAERIHLSARGINRLIKVARSVADIHQDPRVTQEHIAEAMLYFGRGE